MTDEAELDWQVAVFGQNEASRIGACLASIAGAARGLRILVTLILNGCTDNSAQLALQASEASGLKLEIYTIRHADKSNAINRFFYDLRKPARFYCCVDGYATIGAGSLNAFAECFAQDSEVLIATGVAQNGRSERLAAAQTLAGGVVHGQLYALKADFLDRLKRAGFTLPIGLYRGDGLLGSMAAHDLDPLCNEWQNRRVAGVPEAGFEIQSLSVLSMNDWKRQFRRTVRQMRGRIENAAIKTVIYEGGYGALPRNAYDLLETYLNQNAVPRVALHETPFMRLALAQHRNYSAPASIDLVPKLMTPSLA